MINLIDKLVIALTEFVDEAQADQARRQTASGDRLLTLEEVAQRLGGCSAQTVRKRWYAGHYNFIIKDGGRLVASEAGLQAWIEAQTNLAKNHGGRDR